MIVVLLVLVLLLLFIVVCVRICSAAVHSDDNAGWSKTRRFFRSCLIFRTWDRGREFFCVYSCSKYTFFFLYATRFFSWASSCLGLSSVSASKFLICCLVFQWKLSRDNMLKIHFFTFVIVLETPKINMRFSKHVCVLIALIDFTSVVCEFLYNYVVDG